MRTHFVQLSALERVANLSATAKPFSGIVLAGVQHLLETTGSLIEKMIDLGLEPENTFLTGKVYSTSSEVADRLLKMGVQVFPSTRPDRWGYLQEQIAGDVQRMWQAILARLDHRGPRRLEPRAILVLDDGAFAVRNLPDGIAKKYTVIAVEQTTFGARDKIREGHVHVPVIDVAKSAAKRLLEPVLIQKAVIERLRRTVDLDNASVRFGIAGVGHIGKAVGEYLVRRGRKASAFDIDGYVVRRTALPDLSWCTSLKQLVEQSDCILGCSGEDIFSATDPFQGMTGERILASCSSHDVEFRSLLRRVPAPCANPVQNVRLTLPDCSFKILRGGTPVNFDNSAESVPAADISLTRGLLLCALLQAVQWIGRPKFQSLESVKLVPAGQRILVQEWLHEGQHKKLYPPEILNIFKSDSDIAVQSGGTLDTSSTSGRVTRVDQKFALA